MYSEVTMSQD